MPAVRPRLAPPRRQPVTTAVRARPTFCTFTAAGGTVYTLPVDGKVQRFPFPENPPVSPTSGAASVRSRPRRNVVSVKGIVNAFAHDLELDFESHAGIIDHFASSTMTTNFPSGMWNAPAENNPAMPTDAGSSIVMPPQDNTGNVGTLAVGNRNPKAAVFFQGTSASGVYTGRVDVVGANDYDLDVLRWTGTAWTEQQEFITASTDERTIPLDFVQHKGALHMAYIGSGGALDVASTTTGATFADLTNGPSGSGMAYPGRLVDDGNTLYCFFESAPGAIDVDSTADDGATAWTARVNAFSGILRDVEHFFDRNGNDVIVMLTETNLYWFDTTNFVFESLLALPFRGRAITQWGDELLIFMEAGAVIAYKADGSFRDVTPNLSTLGAFGSDANSQVSVTRGSLGIYALWSGLDESGSNQRPLCLLWTGRGWHYIWRRSATALTGAARFVAIDPVSGDLLMALQTDTSADTIFVRLQDIETDPVIQSTLDRQTSSVLTSPRIDFGGPIVPTTVFNTFGHTIGLDANETLAHAYRTNGSTGAFSAIATQAADNERQWLPDNNAPFEGVNARDFQFQWTLALNAASDVARILSIDIGFERAWDIRYVHILDVITDAQVMGSKPPDVILTDIATILNETTKGTLVYGGQTYYALPDNTTRINEVLGDQSRERRAGTVRLVFLSEAA